MTGRVVIQDTPRVREFFQKIRPNCLKTLNLSLRDTADAIEAQAIDNLRQGYRKSTHGKDGGALDTGRLNMGFRGVKDEPMRKVVGNSVSYAAHMEYGTGPAIGRPNYRPPDGALADWSGRKGMEEELANSIIWSRGTQPRRFLGRAYHKHKHKVPELMAEQLAARLSEIARQQIGVKKR